MISRIKEPIKKKKDRDVGLMILVGLVVIFGVILLYLVIINSIANRNVGYEYREYNNKQISIVFDIKDCPYDSKQAIRDDIENLFNQYAYFYKETNLPSGIGANVNIPLRIITVDYYLSDAEYCFCLAHEFVHLSYVTGNETYAQFMTFKTLYESGNEWFKQVALYRASSTLLIHSGDEYDCGYYMIEYLEGEIKWQIKK